MPSASSLFFSRFNARSTGSPLRTITSGINNHSCPELKSLVDRAEPTRARPPRQLLRNRSFPPPLWRGWVGRRSFLRDFAPQSGVPRAAGAGPPEGNGRGDQDRGISF